MKAALKYSAVECLNEVGYGKFDVLMVETLTLVGFLMVETVPRRGAFDVTIYALV